MVHCDIIYGSGSCACYPELNIPEGHDHKYALGTGNRLNERSCAAECRANYDGFVFNWVCGDSLSSNHAGRLSNAGDGYSILGGGAVRQQGHQEAS
jgi:hypothetical protein